MSASPQGLCEFIDASPSPFHVCVTAADRLRAAGFTELAEGDAWPAHGPASSSCGRVRWSPGSPTTDASAPFRIVGGHTDSPNLRVKQHPDRFVSGWQVVALQPYGGAWLNSWLDRDLGISGRLSVRTGNHDRPPARPHRRADPARTAAGHPSGRGPQGGVELNPQRHVNAVWGVGSGARSFLGYVAERAGVDVADVLGADLMTHDLTPSTLAGAGRELLSAPRLDNQATCYAGLEGFLAAEPRGHTARAGAVRPRGGRFAVRPRRAVRTAARRCWSASRWPRGVAARSSCDGCRVRWWPPATWPTPRTRTIPSATNPAT